MSDFRRIVFSKQCDADADFQSVWLRWYREVFHADTILLTPIKTGLSEIARTAAFYQDAGCIVKPVDFPGGWKDEASWPVQLSLLRTVLPSPPFLALSADTDQLFYPPERLPADRLPAIFRRYHVVLDEGRIGAIHLDYTAGFVNRLDHPLIRTTGHYAAEIPRGYPLGVELHVSLRGFDHFLRKVESMQFDPTGSIGCAGHWRRWKSILNAGGVEALREAYRAEVGRWNYSYDLDSLPPDARLALDKLRELLGGWKGS